VNISDSDISHASIAGIAAYIKKPQYGPASIIANNVEIRDALITAICQTGNLIELNEVIIPEEALDVDKLYEFGVVEN
jgi:hypothetical protein